MFQIIPMTSNHNQVFQITLQINGENVTLKFNVRWNMTAGYWAITITDVATGLCMLDSLPLVTGKSYTKSLNILRAFDYLSIGELFLIPTKTKPPTDYPNETNLGTEFKLALGDNNG